MKKARDLVPGALYRYTTKNMTDYLARGHLILTPHPDGSRDEYGMVAMVIVSGMMTPSILRCMDDGYLSCSVDKLERISKGPQLFDDPELEDAFI